MARIRLHSPQTLVVITSNIGEIMLFSPRSGDFYQLPLSPNFDLPASVKCVSVDGKIYVFYEHGWVGQGGRGFREANGKEGKGFYVFDPVGQTGWKELANTIDPRTFFNCGVQDGKIFVFGGVHDDHPVPGSEVYDPKENSWTRIASALPAGALATGCYGSKGETVGEEMVLHGGVPCRPGAKLHFYAYDPVKDLWREIKAHPGGRTFCSRTFCSRGKFYCMTESQIYFLDSENNWRCLQEHVFNPKDDPIAAFDCVLYDLMAVDGEILAIWTDRGPHHCRLFRSRGFCSGREVLCWELVAHFSLPASMPCCIQF